MLQNLISRYKGRTVVCVCIHISTYLLLPTGRTTDHFSVGRAGRAFDQGKFPSFFPSLTVSIPSIISLLDNLIRTYRSLSLSLTVSLVFKQLVRSLRCLVLDRASQSHLYLHLHLLHLTSSPLITPLYTTLQINLPLPSASYMSFVRRQKFAICRSCPMVHSDV